MNEKNKLRRFAGKGLITIIVVLLLCIFFSGTVKTLTTPKVRVTGVSSGRLRDTIPVTGNLIFTETEDIGMLSLPDGMTLTITEVYVSSGQYVRAGDVLFAAEVTGYESKMDDLSDRYADTFAQLLNNERNAVKLSHDDEKWFAAYDRLIAAQEYLLHVQLNAPNDTAQMEAARQQAAEARADFDAASRIGVNPEAYTYRTEQVRLQGELDNLTTEMQKMKSIMERGSITAPHAGYIVSVAIREDGQYDGKRAALVMSSEISECVLRAGISRSPRDVTAGMNAVIDTQEGTAIRAQVAQTGFDSFGIAYADIALDADDLSTLGGAAQVMSDGIPVTIQYTAQETAMQLPISAVRTDGREHYVYTVVESENIFGAQVLTLKKQTVTVLDESDTMTAVSGLNQNAQVAYMEDRALSDGMEVMTYGITP